MNISAGALVLGLTTGLTYALLATGLVLIYKSARFVNFAHGQLGAFSAMLVAKLVNDSGVPYVVALAIGVALSVALALAVELLVIRRLFDAPRIVLMVASIGVAQLLYAASFLDIFRPDATTLVQRGYPTPFDINWRIGDFVLHGSEVMILVLAPLIALAIAYLFKATRTGLRIQAVASNSEAARLAGISARRVSTNVWVIAGVLAALTVILLAPSRGSVNTEVLGPALMARALAAALVGKMVNLPSAFAAGVALGVIEQVSLLNFAGGTTELLVFVLMMSVLLWRAAGLAREHRRAEEQRPFAARPKAIRAAIATAPWLPSVRRLSAAAGFAIAAALPLLPGLNSQSQALLLSQVVVHAILGVSLYVLLSWSGQLSLGQFAFVGIGAYAAARLSQQGFSLPFVVLVGGAIGAVAAIVIGLPAARVNGLFFGVATLGFAVVAPGWLFQQSWVVGDGGAVGPARVPLVGIVETPRGLYLVGLCLLAVVLVAVSVLRRTVARRLIAVRDNAKGAAAHGLPPSAVNLSGFAISGFIAAVAGVLWGYTNVHFDATSFNPTHSLTALATVVIGGVSAPAGAVLGAISVLGIPTLIHLSPTFVFATSGAALVLVLLQLPGGLITHFWWVRDRVLDAMARSFAVTTERAPDPGALALECRDVRVTFGALVALDGISLRVEPGEIVGLVGANGAGKTTLLDCISGHVRPESGEVLAGGRDLGKLGAEYRAYASVGRSFQDARLYPDLTVRETMLVALEPTERPAFLGALLRAPWERASERRAAARVDETLATFGLTEYADTVVGELPTGLRRTCALAAVVIQRPRLVLLDEPTAGVPHSEVMHFAPLIRRLRDKLGASVLLIEHDMGLVTNLCDRVYALESGRVIAEGTPAEVAADPAVVRSYLGENIATIERSAGLGEFTAPRRKPRKARARS